MKKILFIIFATALIFCAQPAAAKIDWQDIIDNGDGSIAAVCAITLLTPRWIDATILRNGEPAIDEEVTITRLTMQGDIPLFDRETHYTNEEGKVFFTTLWGLFRINVADKEVKAGQGAIFKINHITIELAE